MANADAGRLQPGGENMVEEGCELLGYGLCLLATLSYMKTVFAPNEAEV